MAELFYGIAGGLAAVAAAPLVLSAIGFTAGGIMTGSIGAGMMSALAVNGATTAGGVVATLQSAGALGTVLGSTATTGAVAATGAVVGAVAAGL